MKKFLGTSLAMLAVCGFVMAGSGTAYACGDDAKSTSASACTKDKATTATTASAKTVGAKGATCSADHPEACASAKLANGMTAADCAKSCGYAGQCQFRTISIKGMTCGGCEKSVETALAATAGVIKVVSVNHQTGTAMICVDPTKCEDKVITSAVTAKGFEAQIIPAVATTTTNGEVKACSKTTGAAGCCADKKAAETKETASKDNTSKEPL